MRAEDNMEKLQEMIGYQFKDKNLLKTALTHSSYANECKWKKFECNERMEFLGDAVLELVSSEFLFLTHTDMSEGSLTKLRASLVCEPSLALCAREIDLGNYLLLGKGEDNSGGREKDSLISDAMEALIGAVYLDGGLEPAKKLILAFVLNDIDRKKLFYDAKTILQERAQAKYHAEILYQLIEESGPDHDRHFKAAAVLGNRVIGIGTGKTKKAAEQQAAYQALKSGCLEEI